MSDKIPKPILKWVGGKTQIIDKITLEFPTKMNNYYEQFLGGGSVLLAFLYKVKNGTIKVNEKIYASDLNEPLVYTYINIQKNHLKLYQEIQKLITEFYNCNETTDKVNRKPQNITEAKESPENYYYWIRTLYNNQTPEEKKSVTGSAMFIFLNKTCFRGVFRVGPNGFNVPFGHYKKPEIINKEHLQEIHELIQNVIFSCNDFRKTLENIKKGDYIYLDPPYAPETKTSFVSYTKEGFNIDTHTTLFDLIHKLTQKSIKVMMSNSKVSLVCDNFEKPGFTVIPILCKRSINSKNPSAKTMEVIIKNY